MNWYFSLHEESKQDEVAEVDGGNASFLILHNDDHNSFDYVVESLIQVCEHNEHQAEQCAWIAHHKGRCDVRKGSTNFLKPFKEGLTQKGLTVTIED